jgi:hypothetical protein
MTTATFSTCTTATFGRRLFLDAMDDVPPRSFRAKRAHLNDQVLAACMFVVADKLYRENADLVRENKRLELECAKHSQLAQCAMHNATVKTIDA